MPSGKFILTVSLIAIVALEVWARVKSALKIG